MKVLIRIIVIVLLIFGGITLYKNISNDKFSKLLTEDYEPKYLINDLYKSRELNYRLVLDDKEKYLYETIIWNFINFEDSFRLDFNDFDYSYNYLYYDKISEIVNIIFMDHPELIHVAEVSMLKDVKSESVDVTVNYLMNKETYEKNIEEIKVIIEKAKEETADLNEYDKVKYVYDYIGRNNRYGDTKDPMAQSAYSAFNEELSPVCAGYSKASEILFQNIGIKSVLVFGDSEIALFVGNPHAWNAVQIEDKFYLYDVTYSSSSVDTSDEEFYKGFLIDDSKYSPWHTETSPNINGKKYLNEGKEQ